MSVKRYGWVACDVHSCHCDVVESAEGDMVDYEDYAALEQKLAVSQREFRAADATIENLQMQVDKLAAENAGLKELIEQHANSVAVCPNCSHEEPSETDDIVALYRSMETPATNAFLAEVRASAIDSLVDIKTKQLADMHPDTHAFGATAMTIRSQINELQMFADQIRKGAQS